jgi:ribulose-bisphosphate carboxylase large chain
MAHACALGGIDIIKDDHGLSDQPFCRYEERV